MEQITQLILNKYFNPGACAWDINCGWCEEWATEAQKVFGGRVMWLDEVKEYHDKYYEDTRREDGGWDPPHAHAVLLLNERYYDSQHTQGVRSVMELDLVRGVTRQEYLEKSK